MTMDIRQASTHLSAGADRGIAKMRWHGQTQQQDRSDHWRNHWYRSCDGRVLAALQYQAHALERKTTLCRAEVRLGLNIHFRSPYRWSNGCLALAGA
jgi:hypothetical protein